MNKHAYWERKTVQCHQVFADKPKEWPNPVLRIVSRGNSVGLELSSVKDGDWVVDVGDHYRPFLLSDDEFKQRYIRAADDDPT